MVPESPLRYADFANVPYQPSVELGADTSAVLASVLHMPTEQANALAAQLQAAESVAA